MFTGQAKAPGYVRHRMRKVKKASEVCLIYVVYAHDNEGSLGIISSVAFSSSNLMYAAGYLTPGTSSSPNIALFGEEGTEPVMFVGSNLVRAGVTQVNSNTPRLRSHCRTSCSARVQPDETTYSLRIVS
jgi:hypothetical protein